MSPTDGADGAKQDPDGGYPPLAHHLRADSDAAPESKVKSQARLILLLMFGAIPMIVVFVIVLNSLASGPPGEERATASTALDKVTRYCQYEARDLSEYKYCLGNTDARVVDRDTTNAGKYAREEITRCLADAGPRCTLR